MKIRTKLSIDWTLQKYQLKAFDLLQTWNDGKERPFGTDEFNTSRACVCVCLCVPCVLVCVCVCVCVRVCVCQTATILLTLYTNLQKDDTRLRRSITT